MAVEETKHDLFLKRTQVTVAILAGIATLILGVYNVKKSIFQENTPGQIAVSIKTDARQPLDGAYIQLFNTQNVLVNSSESSGGGRYGYQEIAPGSYILKVSREGFEPTVATAQIEAKKTTSLDIILKALPAPVVVPVSAATPAASPIRSALEDAGASLVRKMAEKYTSSKESSAVQPTNGPS